MHQHNNTLRNSGAFKITSETRTSEEIGAVVCPSCSHAFVKLVETGIASDAPINYQAELIQGGATLVTAYIMYEVTSSLLILNDAFSTLQTAIQTMILLITIIALWFALPVLQYMRLYSTWLWCVYALNAVFAPLGLIVILLNWFGGAS